MTLYEIGSFIGLAILGLGLVGSYRRNGKSNEKHLSKLEGRQSQQIQGITDQLQHPVTGLGAIAKNVSEQKEKCAGVVGEFTERFRGQEGRIKDLEVEEKKD